MGASFGNVIIHGMQDLAIILTGIWEMSLFKMNRDSGSPGMKISKMFIENESVMLINMTNVGNSRIQR